MLIDRRKLEKNLPKKGFRLENSKDRYYYFYYKGQDTGIWTKVSHTLKMRELADCLVKEVKRQLQLDTNRQAVELCHCQMSEADYIAILKAKNIIKAV
ncbi:MAG: hypothetical protein LBQ83_06900 [Candidatus Margulisbacteria bacterium]|jgi:hypothetical protein|nr:hypothetical protein [Candidatus Margulisiibacteriota bacterium]